MWRALLSIVEYTQFKMDDKLRHQNERVITAESDSKFVLDSCCCCIPLRTGCLILGYLQLVGLILCGLYYAILIIAGVVLLHSRAGREAKQTTDEQYKTDIMVVIAIFAAFLLLLIISIPFTILLLVGLHKERRNYVKVNLVFMVVSLLGHTILTISNFMGGYASGNEALSAVICTLLSIYFFLVLRSQYIKMGLTNKDSTQHYRDGQQMNIQKV